MIRKTLSKLLGSNSAESQSPVATSTKSRELTFNPETIASDALDEAIQYLGLIELAAKPTLEAIIQRCIREGFKAVATAYRKRRSPTRQARKESTRD